jgi:hypothetical protein
MIVCPHRPCRQLTTPSHHLLTLVIDVDAVPGHAGQGGGGLVVGHHSGRGGSGPRHTGESGAATLAVDGAGTSGSEGRPKGGAIRS